MMKKKENESAATEAASEDVRAQLHIFQHEVEKISLPNRGSSFAYRPTYRAVLAQHGYVVRQTLGSGTYSKVKVAVDVQGRFSDAKVAVKIMNRFKAPKDYQRRFLPRELEIWPRLDHPHLAKMLEMFGDAERVYMVLEYAPGGDTLQYIQKHGAISENKARKWTRQAADAVAYMHDQNIVHRDLKLENLLLDSDMNIKICDFGFVKGLPHDKEELSRTFCGSKSYAAPEVLMGVPYDPKKSDIWALGAILYIYVTGKMPFNESKGTKSIVKEQMMLRLSWPKKQNFSPMCKSLIMRMFTYAFADRPSIHEVLEDLWFRFDPTLPVHRDHCEVAVLPSSASSSKRSRMDAEKLDKVPSCL